MVVHLLPWIIGSLIGLGAVTLLSVVYLNWSVIRNLAKKIKKNINSSTTFFLVEIKGHHVQDLPSDVKQEISAAIKAHQKAHAVVQVDLDNQKLISEGFLIADQVAIEVESKVKTQGYCEIPI